MDIRTPLTELFGIRHPVLLAGMAKVSNAALVAAVTNAGGMGVIGGAMKTPKQLEADIREIKELLHDKNAPFGVDLLLPQVGGSARKTNVDYTKGALGEMIDILCREKPALFVSAVGVPPEWAVDKLHAAGILVGNMVGHPKHVAKALAVGVDILIAQGYEAGGHTGELATSILIPQVVDLAKGHVSRLHGGPVHVVAAGGIYRGRSVAMALALGAQAVWVGTRFIVAEESGASGLHQRLVVEGGSGDTLRTTIYTGRPLRAMKDAYNVDWEENKADEIKRLQAQGIVVYKHEVKAARARGEHFDLAGTFPQYVGQAIGGITKVQPAKEIIDELMTEAVQVMQDNANLLVKARL